MRLVGLWMFVLGLGLPGLSGFVSEALVFTYRNNTSSKDAFSGNPEYYTFRIGPGLVFPEVVEAIGRIIPISPSPPEYPAFSKVRQLVDSSLQTSLLHRYS